MDARPDHDRLYQIAEAQAGYFSSAQAREAGFSAERLSNRAKAGKIMRVASGVYRLAHFPTTPFEDLFIAWLRVGVRSVISHDSALALYQLSDLLPGDIHVIIPRTASRRQNGIRLHTNRLEPGDVTMREGLPVTTPARTIADVAASGLSADLIGQAVREALQRGLASREELLAQASRRGARTAQAITDALKGESPHGV